MADTPIAVPRRTEKKVTVKMEKQKLAKCRLEDTLKNDLPSDRVTTALSTQRQDRALRPCSEAPKARRSRDKSIARCPDVGR